MILVNHGSQLLRVSQPIPATMPIAARTSSAANIGRAYLRNFGATNEYGTISSTNQIPSRTTPRSWRRRYASISPGIVAASTTTGTFVANTRR